MAEHFDIIPSQVVFQELRLNGIKIPDQKLRRDTEGVQGRQAPVRRDDVRQPVLLAQVGNHTLRKDGIHMRARN